MRIVLTGGATGGHIYPALAIGDTFKKKDPDCEIIYIASGKQLEKDIISDKGYPLYNVESRPLDRRNLRKIAGTLGGTLKGRKQALKIMKEFKPDVVINQTI